MVLAPCSLAPAETATVLRLSQFSSPTRFSRAAPRLPAPRPARSVLLPHKKPQQDKPAEQAGNAAQGGRRGTRWQIHARAAPSKRADPRELDVARSKSTTPPKGPAASQSRTPGSIRLTLIAERARSRRVGWIRKSALSCDSRTTTSPCTPTLPKQTDERQSIAPLGLVDRLPPRARTPAPRAPSLAPRTARRSHARRYTRLHAPPAIPSLATCPCPHPTPSPSPHLFAYTSRPRPKAIQVLSPLYSVLLPFPPSSSLPGGSTGDTLLCSHGYPHM